jgi:hypothetical protein
MNGCEKRGAGINHFEKWMRAELKADRLRARAERAEAKVKALEARLARVGARDVEAHEYVPPRSGTGTCGVFTILGPCLANAPLGSRCAAHTADEAGV